MSQQRQPQQEDTLHTAAAEAAAQAQVALERIDGIAAIVVNQWAQTIAPALRQTIEAATAAWLPFWERFTTWLRLEYEAAGSPYGPSDEGMWQWWRELAAAAHVAERAEEEAAWQRTLETLGQHVREYQVREIADCPHCRTRAYNRARQEPTP